MVTETITTKPLIGANVHPVERGRYIIGTREIQRLLTDLCKWIENRVPGAMIYGFQRLGKTRAIQYVRQELPVKFGDKLPILVLPCREYTNPTETTFFGDILRAAGHAFSEKGTGTAKRNRLREFLFEIVLESGQDRIVMFLDEAQKLHEQHYKWLIDLHNELDDLGVSMITILVGQPELQHQYTVFERTGKAQIIGRFMVRQFEFVGIRSASDIAVCLAGFDDMTEFPLGSGYSYTRFFFPRAYAEGWRLQKSAKDLWEAFRLVNQECLLPKRKDISMQEFCKTVENVLQNNRSKDDLFPNLSINVWKQAIIETGYATVGSQYKD
ncbi:MAG TPA: ATP-binding protein [Pyrinomonadaceae bacterium]|jgi:hypothetical protein